MATFLFDKIVFGPVNSRRLGVSLGINLLPVDKKICNFNCIYCECGLTFEKSIKSSKMPLRQQVKSELKETLESLASSNKPLDIVTFAGNGEPTLHPNFEGIIDDTIVLRNKYFPDVEIAVLTNSTNLNKSEIRDSLAKVDKAIFKLDSAHNSSIEFYNNPNTSIDALELIDTLASLKFDVIIQTMFVRGSFEKNNFDNTTPYEIEAWLEALKKIKPSEVQIYTVSRDTPDGYNINKVSENKLNAIADKVKKIGFNTLVSA